jgi:hypothetical protein
LNLTPPVSLLKAALGRIPGTAEAYQRYWAGAIAPAGGYRLERLERVLPSWKAAVAEARLKLPPGTPGRKVLVIGYLPWWMEYGTALGMLLSAAGNQVELGFLPTRTWTKPVSRFDTRRQRAYLRDVYAATSPLLVGRDILADASRALPAELEAEAARQSEIDLQYSLGREEIAFKAGMPDRDLYRLRLSRNRTCAAAAAGLLATESYDCLIIPSGSILEFGMIYRVARRAAVPVVTYEFGEQRGRMWLAQNREVMRLDISELWQACAHEPFNASERQTIESLYASRRTGQKWNQFTRRWQSKAGEGSQAAASKLGLDPIRKTVLLCTNVVGDSLALDRQLFTHGMADWLARTVQYFAQRPEIQLVVRVHPGELLGAGYPSTEIVRHALKDITGSVHVVPPESKINTYDLANLAEIGLVYTTTVGLEMAMQGLPVIVAGATHYRGKGFTLDPSTLDEYYELLDRLIADPQGYRLTPEQVDSAWKYAYLFFFQFPFPWPWHLLSFWHEIEARSLESVVAPMARAQYQATIEALVGLPIEWKARRLGSGEAAKIGAEIRG